jgi:hypothetical protein
MARIDVDELLLDPDFSDDFIVTRSVESVGTDGRPTFVPTLFTTTGVVQAASGRSLLLLPDGARIQGAIEIWTKERLRMNDGYYSADMVLWQGSNYVVSNVEDFLNYGSGYVRVTCTLHDVTGPMQRYNDE